MTAAHKVMEPITEYDSDHDASVGEPEQSPMMSGRAPSPGKGKGNGNGKGGPPPPPPPRQGQAPQPLLDSAAHSTNVSPPKPQQRGLPPRSPSGSGTGSGSGSGSGSSTPQRYSLRFVAGSPGRRAGAGGVAFDVAPDQAAPLTPMLEAANGTETATGTPQQPKPKPGGPAAGSPLGLRVLNHSRDDSLRSLPDVGGDDDDDDDYDDEGPSPVVVRGYFSPRTRTKMAQASASALMDAPGIPGLSPGGAGAGAAAAAGTGTGAAASSSSPTSSLTSSPPSGPGPRRKLSVGGAPGRRPGRLLRMDSAHVNPLYRSVVRDEASHLALERGAELFVRGRFRDAVGSYEEGMDLAYGALRARAALDRSLDCGRDTDTTDGDTDDTPSDEDDDDCDGDGDRDGDGDGRGGAANTSALDLRPPSPLARRKMFMDQIGVGSVLSDMEGEAVALAFASVCLKVGNAHFRLRDFDAALRSFNDAQLFVVREDGEGGKDAKRGARLRLEGQIMNNISASKARKGDHESAMDEYTLSLRLKKEGLRNGHRDAVTDVANTLHNIGVLRHDLGEYDKAHESYRQALSLRVEKCGVEDLSVASTLVRVGDVYFLEGNYDRALRSYTEVLNIWKKRMGSMDPAVASILHKIGLLYYRVGPYHRAKSVLKQAIKIKKDCLADKEVTRIDIASTYHLLGAVLTAMGLCDNAIKCFKTALRIRVKAFAESESSARHLSILTTKLAMGEAHRLMGNADEAMECFRDVCEGRSRRLGFGHESTAEVMKCNALLLAESGNHAAAVNLLLKVLEIQKSRLGADSALVAETLTHLAGSYFKLRRADEADEVAQQSLQISASAVGKDHIVYANSLKGVADLQQARGELGDALEAYEEVLLIKAKWIGNSHLEYAEVLNQIGNTRFKSDAFDGATLAFKEVSESCHLKGGDDH